MASPGSQSPGSQSQAALIAQRKKDKSLTWQPYLTNDGKQDLQELWERLDLARKGRLGTRGQRVGSAWGTPASV